MPLIGHSGPPDRGLLDALAAGLAHRGPAAEGVAGTVRDAAALDGEFVSSVREGDDLVLTRDAAGNRTAYYGRLADGRWAAAAEAQAVRRLPQFEARIRPQAVAEFLTFSFVPGAATMCEELFELTPGTRVRLRTGREPEVETLFDPQAVEPDDSDPAEWPARFRRLLEEEVAARLQPGESPVVFLSGGLDSSIVTAELVRQASRPVRTFAVHFGRGYPNELAFARQVAGRLGTEHAEVRIPPRRAVARFGEVVRRLDEPVGDPVTMPNFELAARVAGLGVTRVWNGEGGDPLFGGPKSLPMLIGEWYGGLGTRERRYLVSYRRALDELGRLPGRRVRGRFEEAALEAIVRPFFERGGPLLHKLLAINTRLKGGHLILPKVERMLAAHGVEPVAPLFTRRMVELAFRSPPRAKLQGGVDKWLMRRAYAADLPDAVLSRPKSGMRVPVHYWFRGPLRRYARRALSRSAVERAGLLDPDRVAGILRHDASGGRSGLKVWMMLTLQAWARSSGLGGR